LSSSGIPPEKFLEALEIMRQEIRATLDAGEAPPSPVPPRLDEGAENEEIRRILEDVMARWAREDRAKAHAAADVPPAAPPDGGRITMETVILRPSSSRRASGDEEPSPDKSTTFVRAAPNAPTASPPSAFPNEQGGDMLLETIVKTSRERSPGAGGAAPKEPSPAMPPDAPSGPSVLPGEEDDLAKTVVLRPDQLKGKVGGKK
jgi:hypothetical protein